MSPSLVSVCIPTYRGATFLAATIDSVLRQSYPHFELWIIDDNSPDNTQEVVSSFSDPRIKYIRNTQNLGPEGNWNKCFELAQGKYFKLLPHDDLLALNCLEAQVAILEEDSAGEIALVFGSREIIDPEGRVIMTRGLPGAKPGRIKSPALIKRTIRSGANLIGEPGNGLFRRSLVANTGLYDAKYPYLVDLDYWFRILMHGDAFYTATRTSSFRVCPGSWSVAIGNEQYRDYKGFINKFRADTRLKISRIDRMIGLTRAKINTLARLVIYRYLFPGKK